MTNTAPREIRPAEPVPERDSMNALTNVLHFNEGRYTNLFVWYEHPSQRSRLISRLERRLPDHRFVKLSLQDPRIDPRERTGQFFVRLKQIADENANSEHYDVVLLLDWEQLLTPESFRDPQAVPSYTELFNFLRPILKKLFSCPLVTLVPQETMKMLRDMAPDFVTWTGGIFFFPLGATEIEAGLRAPIRPQGCLEVENDRRSVNP